MHKETRAIPVAKEVAPLLNIFDEAVVESDVVVWSWNRSVVSVILLRKVQPSGTNFMANEMRPISNNSSHFVQEVLATHVANFFFFFYLG